MVEETTETLTESEGWSLYERGVRTGLLLGIFWTGVACFAAIGLIGVITK